MGKVEFAGIPNKGYVGSDEHATGRPYQIPAVTEDDVIIAVPIADEFKALADAGRINPDDDSYKDFTKLEVSVSERVNREIEKWPESARDDLVHAIDDVVEGYRYRYNTSLARRDLALRIQVELMKPWYSE